MDVQIVQPTHFSSAHGKKLYRTRKRELVPLTLPYLAALVPKDVRVTLIDEQVQMLDGDKPCDVVLITTNILNSFRAYDIARVYRGKGIPVVMGGPHCTFYHDEALHHADAVAIGEGESLVPKILEDLKAGKLQRIYQAPLLRDLSDLPFPRHDLLDRRLFSRFRTVAVQTSRGCPYQCEFCAERYYLGEKYRVRPVNDVIEEIRYGKCRQIFFADSTFVGNRSRTMELLGKLIPERIRWSTLWNAHRVLDPDLMQLAKRSGTLHLNIGVESIKQETLKDMRKRTTPGKRLGEIARILRGLDISFSFNLMFGWDTDQQEDFRTTLEFLQRNKVPVAFFNVFSPHKGTQVYDRFSKGGRLRDEKNMGRWPGIIAEIYPKNFSPEQLEANILRLYRDYYSWFSILRRLPFPKSKAALASWFMNLSQRKMFSNQHRRTNFDAY